MDVKNNDIYLDDLDSQSGVAEMPERPGAQSFWDSALAIAVQHKRVLFRLVLVTFIISIVAAYLIPNQYESTIRIMPPEGPNPAAMLAAVAGKVPAGLGDLATGFLGTKNSGPLYAALLRSRTVLDHQIDQFDLRKVYWRKKYYRTRKKLADRTDVTEDKKSGVITITVSDTDRDRARALADNYVHELDKLLASVSTSSARRERMFIEQRLQSAKTELEAAEVEFGNFASKNSTLDIKEQTKAVVTAGAELQGQIIAAQSELEGLQQTYTDDNIRVRAVKARLASLRREMTKIGGTGLEGTTTSLGPGEISPPVRQLPLLGVKWADLYRSAKIQETVFELLTQQYELAKIQEAKEIPTVRVIDPADYPERKSWPPRGAIILGFPLLVLALAIGWFKVRQDWSALAEDHPRKARFVTFLSLFNKMPGSTNN
jgi:capsule polysaccharide export protein KpsE/RkpR